MPVFSSRLDSRKKREQAEQVSNELLLAIKKALSSDRIEGLAEKYRLAQMKGLKAKLHEKKEREFEKKRTGLDEEKIVKEVEAWKNKSIEEIITTLKNG